MQDFMHYAEERLQEAMFVRWYFKNGFIKGISDFLKTF